MTDRKDDSWTFGPDPGSAVQIGRNLSAEGRAERAARQLRQAALKVRNDAQHLRGNGLKDFTVAMRYLREAEERRNG